MNVYHQLEAFQKLSFPVVTIGTYDGLHLGHQKIIQTVIDEAKKNNGQSVVITFWPHPKKIIGNAADTDISILTTLDEKIELFEKIGIDHLLVLPFNRSLSDLTSQEFIQKVLIDTIGTKKLIIGYDHRFGKDREGSFEYLKQNKALVGFDVEEISRQDLDDNAISSSAIRLAIKNGDVAKAAALLGAPYTLKGIVSKGNQVGRTIGFPTANLKVTEADKLIPADGVYAVQVTYKGEVFGGMLNIGFRPTLDGKYKTIEAHIFDFDKTIYGEPLTVHFIAFIRTEMKFSGKEALQEQLEKDKKYATNLLK